MSKLNTEKLQEWISQADAKEVCEIFDFDVWQQAHDQINFGQIGEEEAKEILDDIEASKMKIEITEKIMFIANYIDGGDNEQKDWFIFLAPRECDRVKEFKFAFEKENGWPYPYQIYPKDIFNIETAQDYRDEQGQYNISFNK